MVQFAGHMSHGFLMRKTEEMGHREGLNEKKTFSFGHCPNEGGGAYPCPNFLALFQEVHFLSINRVYFFKNANVLYF